MFATSLPVEKTRHSKKKGDVELESLPDELFVMIGKSVVWYCDPSSFIALEQTCKRFHSLLTNKEVVTSAIDAEKRRILFDVFGPTDRNAPSRFSSMAFPRL